MKNPIRIVILAPILWANNSAAQCEGTLFRQLVFQPKDTLEIWLPGDPAKLQRDGYWSTYGICVQSIDSGKVQKSIFEGEIDSLSFRIEKDGIAIKTVTWDPMSNEKKTIYTIRYDGKLKERSFELTFKGAPPSKPEYESYLKELSHKKDKYVYKNRNFDGQDTFLELYLTFGITNPKYYISQMDSLMTKTELKSSAAGGETVDRIKEILEIIQIHNKKH